MAIDQKKLDNLGKLETSYREAEHATFAAMYGIPVAEVRIEYDAYPAPLPGGLARRHNWRGASQLGYGTADGAVVVGALLAGPLSEATFMANASSTVPLVLDTGQPAQDFLSAPTRAGRSGAAKLRFVSADRKVACDVELLVSTFVDDLDWAQRIVRDAGRPDFLVPLFDGTRKSVNSKEVWSCIHMVAQALNLLGTVSGVQLSKWSRYVVEP